MNPILSRAYMNESLVHQWGTTEAGGNMKKLLLVWFIQKDVYLLDIVE